MDWFFHNEYRLKWQSNSKIWQQNHNCGAPRKDHNNKWLFSKTLIVTILQVRDVPNFGYGHVYSIECHYGMMIITYEVTIGVIHDCTCSNFVFVLTTFKKRGKFILWKHLYFIYGIKCFAITRCMISSISLH